MKNYPQAVFHFTKACNTAPANISAKQNLAASYVANNQKQEAITVYTQVVSSQPNNWDAQYELAKLYVSSGQKAEAKTILEQIVAKNPTYKDIGAIRSILASLN